MGELELWLQALGLERHAAAFHAAEVDLQTLPYLTEDDLKEIGIPLGPRRRIRAALAETPPPAPREAARPTSPERRQITVMFVDLVGSTRLSEQVDPEILAELLKAYKDLVAREIGAAGGLVAKYLGDGVLAYFGWPQAREDAAQACVRCGLQVIDQVRRLPAPDGGRLQCRIGVATGLVVVGGERGEGGAREESIAGEAPNLAARLQALAEPGAMVVSERTHRQIGQAFECEDLGEHALSGFAVPVRAWRPLREAAHPSRFRGARAIRTSLVGRDHELSLLQDRWRSACEGSGRAVLILGEPGMGKSRLAAALLERIGETPHAAMLLQCSPYHQTKALYPLVEHLMQAAGIAAEDAPEAQMRKLTQLLGASESLPLFAQLLAIPPDAGYAPSSLPPAQLRAATIAALAEWVCRSAAETPLLLLVEDAHWIDATSLELLVRIVGSAGEVPLLTVVTARPEFVSPWGGRAEVSIIGLDRLSHRDCEGLVREIATAALQSSTVKEIVARSDGNPLFVEELSAAVFEAPACVRQGVPDSLQSSLMARLDQLGDAKQTAQLCAVLGRRFARPLLVLVSPLAPEQLDANLALLATHDVIRPVGPGEGRYEFKHALLRDAAYESLLLSQRRTLHEACGRRLEEAFPEVARTEPELLAQHFSLAGLPKEASAYAEQAGDRAAAACAFVEAIASYEEALRQNELLAQDDARQRRSLALLLKLGPAIGLIKGAQAPELRDIYRRAEALSRTAGDLDALFKAVWGLWYNANIGRELDDAAAYAQQLVIISGRSKDENHTLEALHCRWSSGLFRGDYVGCRGDAERGLELYDQHRHHRLGRMFGGHDPGVCAFGVKAQAQTLAGQVKAGLASMDSAIALAKTLEDPSSIAHALLNGLISATVLRRCDLVRLHGERMLELGQRFNVPPQQAVGAYHLAWLEAEAGDRSRGLEQMAALHERVTAIGPIVLLYKVMYADQLLKGGQAEAALGSADRAVAELRFPDKGLVLPELFRLRGEALAALGRTNEALAELGRAEAMAQRDGAALLRVRAAASLYRTRPADGAAEALKAALAAFPADQTDAADLQDARALL